MTFSFTQKASCQKVFRCFHSNILQAQSQIKYSPISHWAHNAIHGLYSICGCICQLSAFVLVLALVCLLVLLTMSPLSQSAITSFIHSVIWNKATLICLTILNTTSSCAKKGHKNSHIPGSDLTQATPLPHVLLKMSCDYDSTLYWTSFKERCKWLALHVWPD